MQYLWLLCLLCALDWNDGAIQPKYDCSKSGRSFKRVTATIYSCVPGFRHFQCYSGYGIPSWVQVSTRDPCICIYRPSGRATDLICPNPAGTLPQARSTGQGVIADTGCPGPFQKYPHTLRVSSNTSYPIPLTGMPRMANPEEECKFRCLTMGVCRAATFGPMNGTEPQCVGYQNRTSAEEMLADRAYNYYWKLSSCPSSLEDHQSLPTLAPSVERQAINTKKGLFLKNVQQLGGISLPRPMPEQLCYEYCMARGDCAGADYNHQTRTCFVHKHTSCQSHQTASGGCCNHFKKHISFCL